MLDRRVNMLALKNCKPYGHDYYAISSNFGEDDTKY